MKNTYIYERNPDTGEVFRRKKLDYNKRELIYKPKRKEKQEWNISKSTLRSNYTLDN